MKVHMAMNSSGNVLLKLNPRSRVLEIDGTKTSKEMSALVLRRVSLMRARAVRIDNSSYAQQPSAHKAVSEYELNRKRARPTLIKEAPVVGEQTANRLTKSWHNVQRYALQRESA